MAHLMLLAAAEGLVQLEETQPLELVAVTVVLEQHHQSLALP